MQICRLVQQLLDAMNTGLENDARTMIVILRRGMEVDIVITGGERRVNGCYQQDLRDGGCRQKQAALHLHLPGQHEPC